MFAVVTHLQSISSFRSTVPEPPGKFAATMGLIAILSAPVILMVFLQREADQPSLRIGDPVPPLILRTQHSDDTLIVGFGGKRFAVLFFSVDCPHCQREISSLGKLRDRFDEKMAILAISVSNERRTRDFTSANQLLANVMLDVNNNACRLLGVHELPALFLVGVDGTVKYQSTGEQSLEVLKVLLDDFSRDEIGKRKTPAVNESVPVYLGSEGITLQDQKNSCGPAALKMVLDHHGLFVSLLQIEQKLKRSRDGVSLLALKESAESLGLSANGWKLGFEDLRIAGLPAIVYVEDSHFLVVDSIDEEGYVFVRDPAAGKMKIPRKRLLEKWNGETLVFRPRAMVHK